MLRIDRNQKALIALERKTMRESGYWERRDIQEMICRTPKPFCEELGENFLIIGSEVRPTDFVQDRIDLLGIDPDGAAVIIEIKRDSHKLHLLQALSYAGMVSKWEPRRFIEQLSAYKPGKHLQFEQAKEELEEILEDGEMETLNRNQRVLLLAEAFDYEVLVTAEWLTERYDVDNYPPPELTTLQFAVVKRKRSDNHL